MDELQNYYDEIKKYDATILAVSIKSPATNRGVKNKLGLQYPMLCDVSSQVVKTYGVLDDTEGDVRSSTFIIDKKGTVTWQHISQNDEDIADGRVLIEKLQGIAGK